MSEREIYWGTEDTADYATRVDTDDNDRAKLLETADGDTVLLEWDGDAGEWVYGGPVNMDGADVGGVGTLDADTVDTEELNITNDGDGSEINSDQIDGYDVEKDGTDGEGVINFKTE